MCPHNRQARQFPLNPVSYPTTRIKTIIVWEFLLFCKQTKEMDEEAVQSLPQEIEQQFEQTGRSREVALPILVL